MAASTQRSVPLSVSHTWQQGRGVGCQVALPPCSVQAAKHCRRGQQRERHRAAGAALAAAMPLLQPGHRGPALPPRTSLLHSAHRRCTQCSSVAPPRASRTGPSSGPRLTAAAGGCPHNAQWRCSAMAGWVWRALLGVRDHLGLHQMLRQAPGTSKAYWRAPGALPGGPAMPGCAAGYRESAAGRPGGLQGVSLPRVHRISAAGFAEASPARHSTVPAPLAPTHRSPSSSSTAAPSSPAASPARPPTPLPAQQRPPWPRSSSSWTAT